jgi:hypothetical protein
MAERSNEGKGFFWGASDIMKMNAIVSPSM